MQEENQRLVIDLYIRVSTDRQAKEGDSLEEQESELKKFCDYRNFKIHKVLIERGKSGGNTNRPEYQTLVADVKAQKINAVVVKKIDRLSRSLLDFEDFMKLLQEKNIEFISIRESFDTTTALGKAMLRIALVFAQLEREQTSERLIDVLSYRASQGLYNGGIRPYGYTNVNKELVPYPKERQIVEIIFEQFLKNKSTTETARFLNETGYRNRSNDLWDCRRIQHILQNITYVGKVKWHEDIYQGIHQPIISERIFSEISLIFDQRKYFKEPGKTKAILQKLLFCGYCGSPMSPSHSLNKIRIKYYYYRCTKTNKREKGKITCKFKYTPFKEIENRVTRLLISLADEYHFKPIELQIKKHNEVIEKAKDEISLSLTNLKTAQENLAQKKERYLDNLISSQFLSSERKLISDKIASLELEEKQISGQIYKLEFELTKKSDDLINLTDFKKLIIHFKANYEIYNQTQLKEFLSANIKEIIYYPDKLGIQFRNLPWKLELT